jgi:hypothetical protein
LVSILQDDFFRVAGHENKCPFKEVKNKSLPLLLELSVFIKPQFLHFEELCKVGLFLNKQELVDNLAINVDLRNN